MLVDIDIVSEIQKVDPVSHSQFYFAEIDPVGPDLQALHIVESSIMACPLNMVSCLSQLLRLPSHVSKRNMPNYTSHVPPVICEMRILFK